MSWLRGDDLRLLRGRRHWARSRGLGVGFVVLVAVALGLLITNAYFPAGVQKTRAELTSWAAPVLSGGVQLLAPLRALSRRLMRFSGTPDEMEQLRLENRELRGWKWRAGELERKLKDLRALAKVVRKPGMGFVTAQVLSVAPGPLRHSILVDAGEGHGIKLGDSVINGDGLVGVVVHVNAQTSRVRLLDDPDTRIAVTVGHEGVLGHLLGDLGGLAKLEGIDSNAVLRAGDQVVTSGSLPGLPRGLKVGMLVSERGGLRVAPYATLARLEYVSVLLRASSAKKRLVDGLPFVGPTRPLRRRSIERSVGRDGISSPGNRGRFLILACFFELLTIGVGAE